MTGPPLPRSAVDNDVILKAACYQVAGVFWRRAEVGDHIGVLGAARFVVQERIERAELARGSEGPLAELETIIGQATVLEPTNAEAITAADLEVAAARAGHELDSGESQLAVIVATRSMDVLETGDKRGIRGLDAVLDDVPSLNPLQGRVRCLEQIVDRVLVDDYVLGALTSAVCSEPDVDMALSICFACRSDRPPTAEDVRAGLNSYIGDLRRNAPRILAT